MRVTEAKLYTFCWYDFVDERGQIPAYSYVWLLTSHRSIRNSLQNSVSGCF